MLSLLLNQVALVVPFGSFLAILFSPVFRYFQTSLGEETPSAIPFAKAQKEAAHLPHLPSPSPSALLYAILCLLVAMQLYTMMELRKVSNALQSLQNSVADQCPRNAETSL